MRLRTYLADKKIMVRDFAKQIEASPSYVSLIMYEKVKPSRRLAKDITAATGGLVTFDGEEKCCHFCGKPLGMLELEHEEAQKIAV